MKTKVVYGLIIVTLALAVLACLSSGQTSPISSNSSNDESGLLGTTWVLAEIQGNEPISNGGALPTITFSGGQASGNSSCNGWGAKYTISGTDIHFEDFTGSEIACENPPGIMDQEQAFIQMLSGAVRFELQNGMLTIFDGSGETIVFQELGG